MDHSVYCECPVMPANMCLLRAKRLEAINPKVCDTVDGNRELERCQCQCREGILKGKSAVLIGCHATG